MKGEIKIDSDFSRILKRDDRINLYKPIDFRLSYTKEYHNYIDNNFISVVRNEIEKKLMNLYFLNMRILGKNI